MKKPSTIFYLTLGIFLFFWSNSRLSAQTGTLKGSIKDHKTQESIIGASVRLLGTTIGTTTDINGNFELKKVPLGLQTVSISFISYQEKVIKNLRIEADKMTIITTTLEELTKDLGQVIVKAQRINNTEIAVISETRQIQQIAVGISAQQIQKTQDRDASAVIRRMPGVSVFDDRFVVIRGLNERYNTVMLNDIITPSTEVDVKSFAFDLIPSSAIDRILIFKSATADLPGDMGGGAVKIYTKTIPDGNDFSMGFSVGLRQNTTFISANSYTGSSTDALGFDNGLRILPNNFPSRNTVVSGANTEQIIDKFRQLPDYYSVQSQNTLPDFRGNLNFSHRFFLGVSQKELTTITYLNYTNTSIYLATEQNRYNFLSQTNESFQDKSLQNNARIGIMSNWSLIINPKNKIEFRNLFNQLAVKETIARLGTNFENKLDISNEAFRFEQRSIYSGQLSSTHEISTKARLRWIGGLGYTYRTEPDSRRFTSTRANGTSQPFSINLQAFDSPTLQQAARFYSIMDEIVSTGTVIYEQIFGGKNEDNADLNKKIKIGTYLETKDRYFEARWFGIVNANRVGEDVLTQAPEQFFTSKNLASNRLYYSEGTNFDDKYTAQNLLVANYFSVVYPFNEHWTATGGLRHEFNRQELQSRQRGSGTAINVDNPIHNFLPSVNLTYKHTSQHIFRAAFSTTLNRPEFRELAPFTYYDFTFDVARRGNEGLKNATIHNLDLRYEFYPSPSEIISLSFFNKQFINPIEASIFYNGSTVAFTVTNSPAAHSRGIELEIRKSLGNPSGKRFIDKIMFLVNGALITSDVKVSGITDQSRYLQGQSPYVINAGLFYNNETKGIQANILYNVIGPRIFLIGDNQLSRNVFELPRHVIDLNFIKAVGNRFDLKLNIQDLLNQPFRLVQDNNRDNEGNSSDSPYQTFRRGTYAVLGMTYKFL